MVEVTQVYTENLLKIRTLYSIQRLHRYLRRDASQFRHAPFHWMRRALRTWMSVVSSSVRSLVQGGNA